MSESTSSPTEPSAVDRKSEPGQSEPGKTEPGKSESVKPPEKRGRLYWFFHNLRKRMQAFAAKHKLFFALSTLVLLFGLAFFRAEWQPLLIALRTHLFVVAFAVLLLAPLWLFARKRTKLSRAIAVTLGIAIFAALAVWGATIHQYMALYYRYRTLDVVELTELPVSDQERIPPLNSIYTIAKHKISETESPQRPDFVRVDDAYRFTLAIEPAYAIRRRFEGVRELFSISGTSPAPDFSNRNRAGVHFAAGESLLGNRNLATAVIRSFGPWRLLNTQPDGVIYTTDDDGEWVQIVPLIRWRGLFFPRPEFGGVQLIRQGEDTPVGSTILRALRGVGRWIPPEDVAKSDFLSGQNILAYRVSRHMANSFRFQEGFFAPLPGYHRGDIRIPDLPGDMNDQPFTAYFDVDHPKGGGKLYHYFALEPFDPERQGLNTSVFVPADGSGPILVYKHHERTGSPTGVSAIAHIVRESRKNYDWSLNRPVEHRPFIKDVAGKRRFFWLTTVVTMAEGDNFTAGSVPDLVLTDPVRELPVWVDSRQPDRWLTQLETELASVWNDD